MPQFRQIAMAVPALLLLASGAVVAQEAPPPGTTFVYLNSAEVVQTRPEFVEMTRTFDQEISDRRTELEEKAAAVDSMIQEYQQQESVLSPQAKEELQQEIRSSQQALVVRRQEIETELNDRQQELLAPILEQVGNVIEEIRAERDYSMVFDISTEGVVAADPTLDITELVKARISAGGADTASSQP